MNNPGYQIEYWPGAQLIKSLTLVDDESMIASGCGFWPMSAGELPTPSQDPSLLEGQMQALLDVKLHQSNAQVTALQGRVDAINDAIEFKEVLPEEIAELPIRSAQLTLWKKYRVALGRVKAAQGWYATPTWPVMPEPYTTATFSSAVSTQ